MKLCDMTIHELAELLEAGEVSSKEITESVFERIDGVEESVGAYVTVLSDEALEQADAADERIAHARKCGDFSGISPLTGIPLALKDNICTKGIRTTCSSRMLEDFVPPYDATVVERLQGLGAVIVGKTNMDEFAMGSSTENSAFHITRNPWDLQRVPGGSSGGSAAAVAAGEAIGALGTDTGGSVRQPASFCGLVGMKPTHGRVSRYGVVAFSSSLDQVGPIAKDVRDCAIMLAAISGRDTRDASCSPEPVPDYSSSLKANIEGLTVGVPAEFRHSGLDSGIKELVDGAARMLEEAGARVVEVSLPHSEHAIAAYYLVSSAEASSNLARIDGIRYGYRAVDASDVQELIRRSRSEAFGPEVKRRIMLGTHALSSKHYEEYYLKAQKVRTLIIGDMNEAFKKCDCMICPTSPTVAFKVGEKPNDPVAVYLMDIYTTIVNLTGVPAVSVPCGALDGMPVGAQLIGRAFDEGTLLKIAHSLEKACAISDRRAPIAAMDGRRGK
ncbi:MAG: Asp-tRNA(Asn)/Glu-tRNA(Gln) amidotransferase subunit GatA [Firmicutes bacterium]|jgi:aspartyl-tRNA(Asn)/glutamyl-tRNA(Gln) amidotransferase subunit A|nr:Asp-tRNA(Asn)/Glu-tRNA(Gln) amidotransferase subunit GatA [Bacillota bacterium]MDD4337202.1 Asp-tRNA(Asn)/Glu-tRNA(Gln) amidotransferase subunit GatA [Bacillota bacterium]MDD4791974.1 Asp-tRNA(Asn)/Glu-tRNA(Gln) amidotransferase subunit GatA [Bacillota bacterium]